ncbi:MULTISPECIES: branched-chain amino acid ABC transporter substrate-binding protein [unclassified Pigmentiphaga]|nr:branched-chain amino acid ABC transporter substrate-binding protein [Pigmentiphaga sp. NML030171]OVZ58570.1 branched-chain amino acid ABC transporter substrate-binding protein [Pigmentiphaga sp. NML030171]
MTVFLSRRRGYGSLIVGLALACAGSMPARAQGEAAAPVRIAVIEAMSGPFANTGEAIMRNLRFAVERINARGGVKLADGAHRLELVPFDSKNQMDEALLLLRGAADQSIRIVMQGNSSAVAAGLIEGVNRHNQRNPGQRMVFLNYSAVDPALTNEKCSPWHFRFDASSDMRMAALTEVMRRDREVRKVYLINQDYSFGQEVSRSARAMLAEKRPDVEVVADEFHAIGKVKDFSPYAAKILSSGADTVITGNWGNDLTLLVKAAREAGFKGSFYTFYGNALGAPAALGDAGVGKVRAVAEWHYNAGEPGMDRAYDDYRRMFPRPADDYLNARMLHMTDMLAAALERAGKVDAAAIARQLSGMRWTSEGADLWMRPDDHQAIKPLYVFTMQKAGIGPVRRDVEGSGYGFETTLKVSAADLTLPTRCKMAKLPE